MSAQGRPQALIPEPHGGEGTPVNPHGQVQALSPRRHGVDGRHAGGLAPNHGPHEPGSRSDWRRRGLILVLSATTLCWAVPAHSSSYDEFFRAVELDNERTVTALLQRGFDPNALSESGQVGLYLALRSGSAKVVRILLTHPETKPDVANEAGETPLMMAALKGEVDTMRGLIERGGQVNREGWSPLHYAASGSSVEAAKLLVERGAAIDARSPNGTTPLMMAARYGSEDLALLFLARGADVKLTNQLGLDAADFATRGGRESLAVRIRAARP